MGLLERIRSGGPPELGAARLPVERHHSSPAEIASRVAAGASVLPLVRELLDQAQRTPDATVVALLAERPVLTGNAEADALLGGIAELLAVTRGTAAPNWVQDPERFLDRFWFVSDVPGFRAVALAQTPVSLKRRGVLWPRRSLQRV